MLLLLFLPILQFVCQPVSAASCLPLQVEVVVFLRFQLCVCARARLVQRKATAAAAATCSASAPEIKVVYSLAGCCALPPLTRCFLSRIVIRASNLMTARRQVQVSGSHLALPAVGQKLCGL